MEARYAARNKVISNVAQSIISILESCNGVAKTTDMTMNYLNDVAKFTNTEESLGDLQFSIVSANELVTARIGYVTTFSCEDPNFAETLDAEDVEGNMSVSRTISLQPFDVRVNASASCEGLPAMNDEFSKFIGVLETIAAVCGAPTVVTYVSKTAQEIRDNSEKVASDRLRIIAEGCVGLITRSQRKGTMVFPSKEGDEARAKIPVGTCASFESTIMVNRRREFAMFDAIMAQNCTIVVTRRDK